MIFTEAIIPGAFTIDIERKEDQRGFFARVTCIDEFAAQGISFQPAQTSISWNPRRGTVRGLHYQIPPHAEAKIVRCTAGEIYDVLLDVRPQSPAHGRWIAFELNAANRRSLFIPEGVAHGFQTLTAEVEVCYQISARYQPAAARGIRWNDATLGIDWPLREIAFVSEADSALPAFLPASVSGR